MSKAKKAKQVFIFRGLGTVKKNYNDFLEFSKKKLDIL